MRRSLAIAIGLAVLVVIVSVYFSSVFFTRPGGRTIVDQLGREVRVPEKIQRIAVLDPLAAEILVALGQTDKIVLRPDTATFPYQLQNIPSVKFYLGGAWNFEAVLNYSPDVVVTFAFKPDDERIQGFIEAGVPVVCISWTMSFDDVYSKIELLGNLTGATERADQVISYISGLVDELESRIEGVAPIGAVFVRDVLESGFQVYGKGMEEEMLELAGAQNLAHSNKTKYEVDMETMVSWNPDAIVLSHRVREGVSIILNSTNPAWKSVNAYVNHMVFQLPKEYRSTSLEAVLGVYLMASWFHPGVNLPDFGTLKSNFYNFMYGIGS